MMMYKLFPILLTAFALTLPVGNGLLMGNPTRGSDDGLLELGRASTIRAADNSPSDFKIISYNIRWRSGEDLKKLVGILQSHPKLGGASILGFQEVDRNKLRSGKTNTARLLAEELGMHYAWAAPPAPLAKEKQEEETGVAIMSIYPLSDVKRIVLPHEGPGHRRRVALGATVAIGKMKVRFYSVHSETRVSIKKKLDQMRAVLVDLQNYPATMPAIVLGDFNTWEPLLVSKTFKFFKSHHFHTSFDNSPTFSRRVLFLPIELKLDWIWLRNLDGVGFGIEKGVTLSDHWPLWTNVRFLGPLQQPNLQ
jgi:endonuclease/exonuclease/phosphatase family metal-dependent hydrolase